MIIPLRTVRLVSRISGYVQVAILKFGITVSCVADPACICEFLALGQDNRRVVIFGIPVAGPVLFNLSPLIYILFALLIITHILFNSTRWGLRVRSVGEHPKAADTLGINVFKIRYISVFISGAIAGLAGSYMSIGAAGRFNEGMTAGKGFLGLAAMIFGNWNPGGAFIGALIFGFFDSWQEKLSILQVGIPVDLLGMAPYIATMVVLAGFMGRSRMPAADGQPYKKE